MILRKLCLLLFFSTFSYSQDIQPPEEFNTPDNILSFADFLFCTQDYFRAALEYDRFLRVHFVDTVQFKAGLAYSNSGNYSAARNSFNKMIPGTEMGNYALLEYYKMYLIEENTAVLKEMHTEMSYPGINLQLYRKMLFAGMLLNKELPEGEEYKSLFSGDAEMIQFYERAQRPAKDPLLAGVLSVLVPGAGKIYTEHYLDALFSFISTGLMAYLAYDNFEAGHNARGWIFTGLAGFFYAGNAYGSAASANEFNLSFRAAFNEDLKITLQKKNYFLPEYGFCR